VTIAGEFSHLSRKAVNVILLFAISYLCETGFSAVTGIRMKYHSMINSENDLRAAITKLQPQFVKFCWKRQLHPPANAGMKRIFYYSTSKLNAFLIFMSNLFTYNLERRVKFMKYLRGRNV
jgi:hypothetical protein